MYYDDDVDIIITLTYILQILPTLFYVENIIIDEEL